MAVGLPSGIGEGLGRAAGESVASSKDGTSTGGEGFFDWDSVRDSLREG